MSDYYKTVKIPIRVIKSPKENKTKRTGFRYLFKAAGSLVLIFSLTFGFLPALSAFEAHIINVTAKIVNDIPEIDPPGGEFCNQLGAKVTLSLDLEGTYILYTTDGSDPVCPSQGIQYTEPFTLFSSALVKARSCHGDQQSSIASWYFDVSSANCPFETCMKINEVYYRPPACDGACHDPCPCGDTVVNNENSAAISNDVFVSANTGGNSASGGTIETGNASSSATLINIINTSHTSIGHCRCNYQWLELYNTCDSEVNLKSWYLENSDVGNREIIRQNYIVEPGQFVLLAANASLWKKCWGIIPANVVKIALGGRKIFDHLDDEGDHVFLFDSDANRVDEVSWGSDTSAFDPSVPLVAEGHSIARITAGYDTDTAADWEDLDSPTPGTNPDSDLVAPSSCGGQLDSQNVITTDNTTDTAEVGGELFSAAAENSSPPNSETQSNATSSADEPTATNQPVDENFLENETPAAQEPGEQNSEPVASNAPAETSGPEEPVNQIDSAIEQAPAIEQQPVDAPSNESIIGTDSQGGDGGNSGPVSDSSISSGIDSASAGVAEASL